VRKVPMCGGNGSAVLKRSDWGMKYGIPNVSDEVRLFFEFEGYRE
jgi:polyisoprenoid-binding protein YceI